MARLKTTRAESCGGVVYRGAPGALEVCLVGRSESGIWALPKGTPIKGETREETALRETREETGLEARIIAPIDSITYWFVLRTSRVCKTVYYYLMVAVGGNISQHDPEYDLVAWFPVAEALRVMSYPNEIEIVQKAIRLIERRFAATAQGQTSPGGRGAGG